MRNCIGYTYFRMRIFRVELGCAYDDIDDRTNAFDSPAASGWREGGMAGGRERKRGPLSNAYQDRMQDRCGSAYFNGADTVRLLRDQVGIAVDASQPGRKTLIVAQASHDHAPVEIRS
jgi:hypothetical protein